MKYKVGDRVIVRKDLVGGLEYPYSNPLCGKLYFASAMEKFRGEMYEVITVSGEYDYGCETLSMILYAWPQNFCMAMLKNKYSLSLPS